VTILFSIDIESQYQYREAVFSPSWGAALKCLIIRSIEKSARRPGSQAQENKTVVAEKRAEILGMITQLRAKKHGRGGLPRVMTTSPPASKRAAAPSKASAPINGDTSLGGLMRMMQNLDSRLMRIEDDLRDRPKSADASNGKSQKKPPIDDPTFSGVIQGQMLSDMLQLVSSNQMSGIFIIENDLTSCTLYFDEGRICHAANADTSGEDAFFAAFALGSGRYHFKEMTQLPPERTVSAGTQYLVLEALRRMDEKSEAGGGS
jgi:hypothetical protein